MRVSSGARGVGWCGWVRADQKRPSVLHDRQDLIWGLMCPGLTEGLCGVPAARVLGEALPVSSQEGGEASLGWRQLTKSCGPRMDLGGFQ